MRGRLFALQQTQSMCFDQMISAFSWALHVKVKRIKRRPDVSIFVYQASIETELSHSLRCKARHKRDAATQRRFDFGILPKYRPVNGILCVPFKAAHKPILPTWINGKSIDMCLCAVRQKIVDKESPNHWLVTLCAFFRLLLHDRQHKGDQIAFYKCINNPLKLSIHRIHFFGILLL